MFYHVTSAASVYQIFKESCSLYDTREKKSVHMVEFGCQVAFVPFREKIVFFWITL